MILCTGLRSSIIQELQQLHPEHVVLRIDKRTDTVYDFTEAAPDTRIVLAGGYLAGLAIHDDDTFNATMWANYLEPEAIITQALAELPEVRICVVGSMSGITGSFDNVYAKAKAKVHRLVERKLVKPPQQLVAVAPPIIADSGMTRRRHDYPDVLKQRPHCMARDVARVIAQLLLGPIETNNAVVQIAPTVTPGRIITC